MENQVKNVYTAIAAVTAAISKIGVGKNNKNTAQNYAFRGIDDVFNALSPLLAANKLCILPRALSRSVTVQQSGAGKSLNFVTVEVAFDFVSGVDGSMHTVVMYGEAMDSADKATNKALSAAYKYAAMQAFCIPTVGNDSEADGDGVIASGISDVQYQGWTVRIENCKTSAEIGVMWQEIIKICRSVGDSDTASRLKLVCESHGNAIRARAKPATEKDAA